MWEMIYKYAFVTIHILGIILCLWRIGKGEHQRKETPLGNGIGMLVAIIWLLGFILFFW